MNRAFTLRHTMPNTGRFSSSQTNSRSFVRLFLTLGKNTLDYLSRINK